MLLHGAVEFLGSALLVISSQGLKIKTVAATSSQSNSLLYCKSLHRFGCKEQNARNSRETEDFFLQPTISLNIADVDEKRQWVKNKYEHRFDFFVFSLQGYRTVWILLLAWSWLATFSSQWPDITRTLALTQITNAVLSSVIELVLFLRSNALTRLYFSWAF